MLHSIPRNVDRQLWMNCFERGGSLEVNVPLNEYYDNKMALFSVKYTIISGINKKDE